MYNERKTAQIAAWFISKEGGSMPHLKLMKLLYLSERQAMATYGYTLTGDHFVSMPHGPVLSLTLDHINDAVPSYFEGWNSWISDKANFIVGLVRQPHRDQMDEVSDADLAVLEATWAKFGHMTKYQIRDYTHYQCAEWRDPQGSSQPIAYDDVFLALGFNAQASSEMAAAMKAQDRVARALAA